tara:strand:+ start:587 stop:907 length:321 start_codon:yes stop_codon:yes gene_type:complete
VQLRVVKVKAVVLLKQIVRKVSTARARLAQRPVSYQRRGALDVVTMIRSFPPANGLLRAVPWRAETSEFAATIFRRAKVAMKEPSLAPRDYGARLLVGGGGTNAPT